METSRLFSTVAIIVFSKKQQSDKVIKSTDLTNFENVLEMTLVFSSVQLWAAIFLQTTCSD